jgi:phosphatidylglycerophosphate synthase
VDRPLAGSTSHAVTPAPVSSSARRPDLRQGYAPDQVVVGSRRGAVLERVGDALLILLALACAAWSLLWSAFCIGDSCPQDLRVTWWAWLAIAGALGGSVLVLRTRTRGHGRLLLLVPVLIAVVVTFAAP